MKRTIALSCAATVLAALLGACSSGDSGSDSSAGAESSGGGGDYCSELEDARSTLTGLGSSASDLDKLRGTFNDLGEAAPEEVSGDWKTMTSTVDGVATELDKAGVDLDDLQGLQTGQLPKGVTQQDLAPVLQAVQKLQSQEFQQAAQSIQQHAQQECDITLGPSPSPGGSESGGSESGGSESESPQDGESGS